MRIRDLRTARQISQQTLGEMIRMSRICVSKIECGSTRDPAVSSVYKIARALHVSLDTLVGKTLEDQP